MRQKKGMFLMPRRFSLKTRLLSLLLSAAMVLMFLPASAFAADDEQVRVGDAWLGSATRSVTCGEGTAAYDPDTKTLTLTNVTINHDYNAAIWNTVEGLTIKLVGENSINSGDQTGILSMQGCGHRVKVPAFVPASPRRTISPRYCQDLHCSVLFFCR